MNDYRWDIALIVSVAVMKLEMAWSTQPLLSVLRGSPLTPALNAWRECNELRGEIRDPFSIKSHNGSNMGLLLLLTFDQCNLKCMS